jgi:iron(III) transport system permease protein
VADGPAAHARPRPWLNLALLALLLYLVAVPLAMLLASSFKPTGLPLDPGWSLGNYRQVYGDKAFYALMAHTFEFSLGCTLGALLLGGVLAWITERTDLPFKAAARVMVVLPMVLPPFLLAMGWVLLASPRTGTLNQIARSLLGTQTGLFNIYSMGGMIFVESLALVPSVYLILASAFRNMDPALEEAAMASGARWPVMIRRIFVPMLAPAILAAAAYLLIVGFLVFDIPGTLGMPVGLFVVSSRIVYLATDQSSGTAAYGQIAAIGATFLLLLLALAWLYRRMTRQAGRYVTVTGKGFRPRELRLGGLKAAAVALVLAYFALAVLAPLCALVWTSLTPYLAPFSVAMLHRLSLAQYSAVLANTRVADSVWLSVWVSVASATAAVALALLVAWTSLRGRGPARSLIDVLAFLPLAIPGTMVAMALIYVYLTIRVGGIYGSPWILVIAYVTVYLSFTSRSAGASLIQLHPELEEAAATCGARAPYTLRRIVLPLMLPALLGMWVWVVAHVMRELSTALLLQGDDNATVAVKLWSYWAGGEPNKAAVIGVGMVLAMTLVTIAWQYLMKKHSRLS